MQSEVDTATTTRPIRILGVNAAGEESDNAIICAGRVLPWLQDTPQARVWDAWQVTWRDVVVLDGDNRVILVYNLTDHDLSSPANYAELKSSLLGAAR
jgi:hypothetical protein